MKNILYVFIMALTIASCIKEEEYRTPNDELSEINDYISENNITTSPTWTGLFYMETKSGEGIRPKLYDTVTINYYGTTLDGTFLHSSDNDGKPVIFGVGTSTIIPGLSEAVQYMNVGTKASLIIPSNLAYGQHKYDALDAYSTLLYDIELLKIKPGIYLEPYDVSDLQFITTDSGLEYYIVTQDETQYQVAYGDYVTLHYSGYLSNGKLFDSSVKRGRPSQFQIGMGYLIEGWDEGLQLMKEGSKFRFIIPPDLAYGSEGSFPLIPGDATLIFDVEIISID